MEIPEQLRIKQRLFGGIIANALVCERSEERLQQMRRELEHLTRVNTIGELTATLAHELNQPLAAILSNAQAARRFLTVENPGNR